MAEKVSFISAVGRRKEAIARVRLTEGRGILTINSKPADEYFKGAVFQHAFNKPFVVTNTLNKFSGTILVSGGGTASQLGAVVHGLARALSKTDTEKFRKLLKVEGLLTRDPRVKERRKYGLAQKARAKKQSPKR